VYLNILFEQRIMREGGHMATKKPVKKAKKAKKVK